MPPMARKAPYGTYLLSAETRIVANPAFVQPAVSPLFWHVLPLRYVERAKRFGSCSANKNLLRFATDTVRIDSITHDEPYRTINIIQLMTKASTKDDFCEGHGE